MRTETAPPSHDDVRHAAPPSAGLHGRDDELAALRRLLDDARDGRGGALLIEGRPGLGKTRLLETACQLAAERGIAVGRGGAQPGQGGLPIGPLLAALFEGADPLLRRAQLRDLEAVSQQRYWLLQELQELLERRAATAPLLLCLDDLQWADDGTLAALRTLVPRLAGHPIAWLGTFRPAATPPALDGAVAELRAHGSGALALGPLDEQAVQQLVGDLLDAAAEPELLDLAGSARGNPFLLTELLLGLREEALLRADGDSVGLHEARLPARLRDSMRERLARMTPGTRQAAIAAAVLGRELRFADLAALLDTTPAKLLEAVEELVRADVLVEGRDTLRFRHDLIREAVLDALPRDARRTLDREAADVLLATGAPPVEIAARLVATADPGDAGAITTLHRAALALGASDPAAACELSTKALSLIGRDAPERIPLIKETALLLHLAGRGDEARAFAADALAAFLTPAEQAEVGLAVTTMFTLAPALRVEAGRSALELPDVPETLRALHASVLVLNLVAEGKAADARAAETRAQALVTAVGDRAAGATLAMSRLALAQIDDRYGAVLAGARACTAGLGSSAEDRTMRNAVEYFRASALIALNRVDEALTLIGGELIATRRDGQASMEPRWELDRGRTLLQAGRIADAQAALEGVLLDGVIPSPLPIPPDAAGLLALARAAIHTGDEQQAQRCTEIARETLAVDFSDGRRQLTWLLALQAMARHDAAGVRSAFALLGEQARESVLPLLARDTCDEPQLVRAALLTRDDALADDAVATAERRAAVNPEVPTLVAAAAHARGLRGGDADELGAAVAGFEGGARPLALASALEDLGCRLAHGRRRTEAVDALGRSLDQWARCGASWDARRVRRRLRELGVRRRVTAAERPATGWEGLTASELEVVRLVAQGRTNRETAERLYISSHTVSTHLRHVFAKLQINSRVELARIAAQRQR